ncbi:hypothetical protein Pan216_25190 [Planctomycetes bacterium Pan216]|uniref:Uncharacterized protein n=1 Tax=Kolteria novifilia TaxID=2527975 RepID=A0A518B3U2_9BACT|nr:hypothetical protein Pan216_25190 [Planctomycetes bacterium Pan216]
MADGIDVQITDIQEVSGNTVATIVVTPIEEFKGTVDLTYSLSGPGASNPSPDDVFVERYTPETHEKNLGSLQTGSFSFGVVGTARDDSNITDSDTEDFTVT